MTKEEIGSVLKELRIACGMTQKEVAERLGRNQPIVGHWETGYAQPDANTLFTLCNMYGVTVDDAFGFQKNNSFSKSEYDYIQKYRSLDSSGKKHIDYELDRECARMAELNDKDNRISTLEKELIPKRILAYHGKIAAAGQSCGFNDIAAGTIECPLTEISQNADYAIGVNGDSMEPTYQDGDIVYVKKATHLDIGDIGIFQKDNGIYIKEVGENGLISHNQQYKPMVNGGAVICLGKVLGRIENF